MSLEARRSDRLLTLASVVGLIVIWCVVSQVAGSSPVSHERFVPSPLDLVRSFDDLANYWNGGLGVASPKDGAEPSFAAAALALVQNSAATIVRLVVGLALGYAVAVVLASIISWSSVLRRMLHLPAHAARMLPLMAMAPLFAIWFGNSERGALLFVAFATFAIMFVVVLTAIGNVPGHYENCARSQGAGPLRAYLTAVLPAALPALRGGVMLTLGFGWSMVIAAESIGQDTGLGAIVNKAQEFGLTNTLAVLAIFVIVYAWISFQLVGRLFDWLTRWAE